MRTRADGGPRRTYYHERTKHYRLTPETLTETQVCLVRLLTFAIAFQAQGRAYEAAMLLTAMQSRARNLQKKYHYRRTDTSKLTAGMLAGTIRRVETQLRGMADALNVGIEFTDEADKPSVRLTFDGTTLDLPA